MPAKTARKFWWPEGEVMTAQANEAGGQDARSLREEIEQLRTQLAEANEAVEQERGRREEDIGKLSAELQRERERGFFRKLFGLGPRPSEDTEQYRERMRGRLAVRLVSALLVVVVGTFAYLWIS